MKAKYFVRFRYTFYSINTLYINIPVSGSNIMMLDSEEVTIDFVKSVVFETIRNVHGEGHIVSPESIEIITLNKL